MDVYICPLREKELVIDVVEGSGKRPPEMLPIILPVLNTFLNRLVNPSSNFVSIFSQHQIWRNSDNVTMCSNLFACVGEYFCHQICDIRWKCKAVLVSHWEVAFESALVCAFGVLCTHSCQVITVYDPLMRSSSRHIPNNIWIRYRERNWNIECMLIVLLPQQ